MNSEYEEQFRQALKVIRKANYDDLQTLQDVVRRNMEVIENERKRVKKIEIIEVGHYAFSTFMPVKSFRSDELDQAKEFAKRLIDEEKRKQLTVGYKTRLVYPDEYIELGLD